MSFTQVSRNLIHRPSLASLVLCLVSLVASVTATAQTFSDNFDRADNATLGNGWIEKQPTAFSIVANEASKLAVGSGYRDNLVYRPATEDLLDVEAAAELRFSSTSWGYPQVMVRVASATAATANVLDGYILYLDNAQDRAVLGRQQGSAFVTTLATVFFATPLNTTDRFRFRLSATGTTAVDLTGTVERWNGTAWTTLGQATFQDTSANRIATAGSVGFGGYTEASYRYDNFTRTNLGAPATNPVPAITSVTPNSVVGGSGAFTLNVQGSNFITGSVVRWNGADRTTTYVSATQLQAAIQAADVATPGTGSVTVFNPAPGGGTSNTASVAITDPNVNPVPTISSLTPSTATTGGSAFSLNVQGTGFVAGAVVRWNGADRTTTFVSSTQLQAAIAAGDIATAGARTVTVLNPAPGGGLSNGATFTVNDPVSNPVPTLTSLNPSSAFAGSSAFLLTVTGTNFVSGSTVRWNGANRTTTYVSATQLQASIAAADIAAAGVVPVTVFSPTPGGGTSNAVNFSIQAVGGGGGSQTLLTLAPLSATAGAASLSMTVTGSGFTSSSAVRMNGTTLTTTFVSSTQLTATVPSSLVASAARHAVVVYTPTAQNSISQPLTFFVLQSGEQMFFDGFNRPDNEAVGNGWTEKQDAAFRLQGGGVTSIDTTPFGFTDTIMYRPAAEDSLDTETSVEFSRQAGANTLFPQVHARVVRSTVDQPSLLSSYTLFYDDRWTTQQSITITTIEGWGECYMGRWPLTQAFVNGDRYRLRFIVRGSLPIVMTGYLDHLNVDRWETIATGSVSHDYNTQPVPGLYCNTGTMTPPLTGQGGTGLAKWRDPTDRYDNYYAIRLSAQPNPVPTTSSLAPSTTPAGSATFTLTVNGSNFLQNSVVRWNGVDRTTTYVSPTQIRASIPSTLVATAGTASVQVFNPAPGGGLSNAQTFTITTATNPTPSLVSLSPGSAYVNTGPVAITVGGSGFVAGSAVRWNGTNLATTYVSSSSLTATIPAANLTTAGSFPVTVFNPTPGGGTSNALNFTVNPAPTGAFTDDFARADADALGNAWVEKSAGAFSLAANAVLKLGVGTGYRDNLVYRPAAENVLDVESSVEIRFAGASIGYPQLYARLQTATATTANTLDSYVLYADNANNRFILGRNRGVNFVTTLANIFLNESLNSTDRYRLRLRATGTTSVQLNAYIERFSASGWVIIGQGSATDTSAERISTAGSVGFGGYTETGYTYDTFSRLPL